jgi:DNA-binding transcriptional ArsR family regulator
MSAAPALDVIQNPRRAAAILQHPLRRQILQALAEPGSASRLARQLGEPRQKINYHLRELEAQGLLEPVEERRKGNCVERIVRATAAHYLISPDVAGSLAADGGITPDRFSSTYLIAVAARVIREVAELRCRAAAVGKPLPTLTLETDIRFRCASDRNAFAEELAQSFAQLAAKYHDEHAKDGRPYRFMLGGHPIITKTPEEARAEELAAQEAAQGRRDHQSQKEPHDD